MKAYARYNALMHRRGFSLVELLVVIAIIGILASVVMASMTATQARARDARRLEDINTLQKALALYLIDNGTYPIALSTTTLSGSDSVMTALIASGNIAATPKDPTSPVQDYTYRSNTIGTIYTLTVCMETDRFDNYTPGCDNYITP